MKRSVPRFWSRRSRARVRERAPVRALRSGAGVSPNLLFRRVFRPSVPTSTGPAHDLPYNAPVPSQGRAQGLAILLRRGRVERDGPVDLGSLFGATRGGASKDQLQAGRSFRGQRRKGAALPPRASGKGLRPPLVRGDTSRDAFGKPPARSVQPSPKRYSLPLIPGEGPDAPPARPIPSAQPRVRLSALA